MDINSVSPYLYALPPSVEVVLKHHTDTRNGRPTTANPETTFVSRVLNGISGALSG